MSGDTERIRDALHFIPASDRDTWVKMGMAVKSELGDEGFDVWESWSEQDESFDPKAAREVWKSLRSNGKVTAGTLFHEAKARGWRDNGTHPKVTAEALTQRRRIAEERAAQEEAERAKREATARERASLTWAEAQACATHPYLTRKGIAAHGTRLLGDDLVIPLRDAAGVIHSLQFINREGDPRFMPGGRVTGHYFSIGNPESGKALCIAEGFATGASVHEATQHPVAIAFNAGNLAAVAKALQRKFPDLQIIVCADDDYRSKDNPGLTKATAAARTIGGLLAIPDFGTNRPEGATDFNDLAAHCGAEAVKRDTARARAPEEAKTHTGNNSAPGSDYVEAVSPIPDETGRPCFRVFDDEVETENEKYRPGVWHFGIKHGKDNTTPTLTQTWICSPLHIKAVTFDAQDNNFGRLLCFTNTNGHSREWAMPMELLKAAGDDLRGELLAMGVSIDPGGHRMLGQYLQARTPEKRMRCALQVGWCGDSFVLPDTVIGAKATEIIFQSGERGHEEYTKGGTFDGWQRELSALAIGNPLLLLALSASFAGPLLDKCHAEGGGLHFVGDSSTGKTTVIEAACATWGGTNFKRSWRATANGMEGAAALVNDGLLALDEISECDPKEIGAIVYALGNGTGKQRASRTGNARSVTRWRCMVLSSGERSIGTAMAEGGYRAKAGQSVRLLDVPAARAFGAWDDLHGFANGAAFADALKKAAATHYGHAGRAFLEKLTRDTRNFSDFLEQFKALPGFAVNDGEGQDKRAAGRFALLAMAGELATEYGLTGWPEGAALDAAAQSFKAWQSLRGRGNDERRQILEAVSGFIERHGDSRFSDAERSPDLRFPDQTRDRAGWWRDSSIGRVYLFTNEGLRDALKSFDFKRALDVLQAEGALPAAGVGGERAKPTRIKARGEELIRLYTISAKKLEPVKD